MLSTLDVSDLPSPYGPSDLRALARARAWARVGASCGWSS